MSKKRRVKKLRPHLYIMRGLPGSRKSRLAREIRASYGSGVILSTDDYFKDEYGKMHFKRSELQKAHQWNRDRAYEAMENQSDPIIIDNTNISHWEMKPYVQMGLQFQYYIIFCCTPDTWKCSTEKLHRRTRGRVPQDVIDSMMERFDTVNSIYDVLNS